MADEKMNSPREAAAAILAKAQKLLDKKSTSVAEDIKTEDMKKSAEHTSGMHTVAYYGLEKHNPQQAALAVLAKAQDLLSQTVSVPSEGMQKSAEAESGMHKVEYYKSEKGVHSEVGGRSDSGMSHAGAHARDAKEFNAPKSGAIAKDKHKQVLGEMQAMPKPNLPKSEMLCSEHAIGKAEGHTVVSKAECVKCTGGMQKSEFSDLYADLAALEPMFKKEGIDENEIGTKFAKDEGQGSGVKEKPSNSAKPRIEEKPTERDYKDFETQPGKPSASPDHRQAPQAPPQANPAENKEGNNPPAGAAPGAMAKGTPGTGTKGVHKLSFMLGHLHAKKMKKGIAIG